MGDQIISPCEDEPMGGSRRLPHLTPAPPAQWSQLPVTPPSPLGWSLCGSLSPGPGAPCRAGSLPSLRSRTVPSSERTLRAHVWRSRPGSLFHGSVFTLVCTALNTLCYFLVYCLLLPPESKLSQSERPSAAAPLCLRQHPARSRRVCPMNRDAGRTPLSA